MTLNIVFERLWKRLTGCPPPPSVKCEFCADCHLLKVGDLFWHDLTNKSMSTHPTHVAVVKAFLIDTNKYITQCFCNEGQCYYLILTKQAQKHTLLLRPVILEFYEQNHCAEGFYFFHGHIDLM